MAAFHASNDRAVHADVWERHPRGQEVLCVLSGEFNVYLRESAVSEEPAARLAAGQSYLVPAGQWHRLSVVEAGDLLVITVRSETEHELLSGANSASA